MDVWKGRVDVGHSHPHDCHAQDPITPPLEKMLRLYFVQQWIILSDLRAETVHSVVTPLWWFERVRYRGFAGNA